jgi:hypothetical protein
MDSDIYAKISDAQNNLNHYQLDIQNLLINEFPKNCHVCVENGAGKNIPLAGTVVSHNQDNIGVQLHKINGTGIVRHYNWKELKKI